jgi:hypothetical protein
MSELPDLLAELEVEWNRLGLDVDQSLAPGIPTEVARAELAVISSDPCEEAVEWFAWHNGPSAAPIEIAPSGFDFLSIKQSVAERSSRRHIAADAAADMDDPGFPTTAWWRDSWLPIGRIGGAAVLAIDLATDAVSAPAYNVDWQDLIASGRPAAASLAEVVKLWLTVLRGDYYRWIDGHWQYDFAAVPAAYRASRLVG